MSFGVNSSGFKWAYLPVITTEWLRTSLGRDGRGVPIGEAPRVRGALVPHGLLPLVSCLQEGEQSLRKCGLIVYW
jgi:hypothetical protein